MLDTPYPTGPLDSGTSTDDEKTAPLAAKLQILQLPQESVGEASRWPFALVLSEMDSLPTPDEFTQWQRFKDEVGAVAILITPRQIEVL